MIFRGERYWLVRGSNDRGVNAEFGDDNKILIKNSISTHSRKYIFDINKKSIIRQYHANWGEKPDFRVYGSADGIGKVRFGRALRRVPAKGPTKLIGIDSFNQGFLWGILNDERISKGDW